MPRSQTGQTRRQEQAIAELISGATIEAAATRCGVSQRTLQRWLASDEFQRDYAKAKRRLLELATNRMLRSMDEAVQELLAIMRSEKASLGLKLSAASRLIDRARWAHEDDDLAQRIAELERQFENTGR